MENREIYFVAEVVLREDTIMSRVLRTDGGPFHGRW